ncbi:MAG: hypothetical protein LKF43_00325 [Streptococcaceae bacterium]|jgi:hypothetical protein|nr:hypothetical protein [Streptococcaceae bacterium]
MIKKYYVFEVRRNANEFRKQRDYRIWNALKIGKDVYGIFDEVPSEVICNFFNLLIIGETNTLDGALKILSKSRNKNSNRVRDKDKRILFLRMSFLGCQKNRSSFEENELNVLRKIFDGVEEV